MRLVRSARVFRRVPSLLVVVCAPLLSPAPLLALQFDFGEVTVGLDTTVSLGGSYRLDDPNPVFYGTGSGGGQQASVNADDGNLNYRKGIFSLAAKATSDLEFEYKNIRAFFRGSYLYDRENADELRARRQLTPQARDKVAEDFDLLDYFVAAQFELGDKPLDLRVGSQVLSWGESTFIQNGINVINPLDVARIRTPGSELKEALLPVKMISGSLGISDNVTLEGFYQFDFQETEIDPPGTYFSTNDFAGEGGQRVYLGFGAIADTSALGYVGRAPDRKPSNSGQFGIAARVLAPGLNETEFGLYFINYHSRLPLISAITPTTPINTNLTGPLTFVFTQAGLPATQAAAQATAVWNLIVKVQTQGLGSLTPTEAATFGAATTQAAISNAQRVAFLTAAGTGRYVLEYPEDIKLFGVSFNTDLGTTGVSLQGEVSYKADTPLQVDDIELLFAALSAINPAFGAPNNQLGSYLGQLNTRVQGWQRKDVWQTQVTATKIFGPTLGAGQWLLLGEIGATYVPGLPDKGTLRFDGSGTFTGGSAAAMTATGNGAFAATPLEAFADRMSWGYQLVTRLDYSNVFFNLNMSPTLAFSHDVSGNTPLPLGNFIAGRKSLTAAVEFTYLNAWSVEFRYVDYFGAGRYNLLGDRDFVSTVVKYSF